MGITPQSDQDLNQQLINLQGNTPSMLTPVNQGNNINTSLERDFEDNGVSPLAK